MNRETIVEARRAHIELGVAELDDAAWLHAPAVRLTRYWSGEIAPPARQAEARLLWNEQGLYARFNYEQREPFIMNATPQLDAKTLGLWDRDVCEMYVAPRADEPMRYYEFEVAPTGEWVDLAIHKNAGGRETGWDYVSGMTVAARVTQHVVTLAMRVPWEAFGDGVARPPQADDRWRVNLFRCVGAGAERGYVVWQPTYTPAPNYHVPDKFGWLCFSD